MRLAILGWTHRQYRKALSELRKRINVLERLMSENRWDEIEFDKIPSKAGLVYRNAFARRDIIAKKYESFAKDTNTKVNAEVLYPYEELFANDFHRSVYRAIKRNEIIDELPDDALNKLVDYYRMIKDISSMGKYMEEENEKVK